MSKESPTLAELIRKAIQKRLDKQKSFTAYDILKEIERRWDLSLYNRASVITGVQKQMRTIFADVPKIEVPGNGPRPVHLFKAS